MKNVLRTIFIFLVFGNFVAVINIFKIYRYETGLNMILNIHWEISIYALKCSIVAIIANYIYKSAIRNIDENKNR